MNRFSFPAILMATVCLAACSPNSPSSVQPNSGDPAWEGALEPGDKITSIEDAPADLDTYDVQWNVTFPGGDSQTIVLSPDSTSTDDSSAGPANSAIADAVGYLLSQQSEDGGIKSKAYGVLRPGAATTALALYAIAHADEQTITKHREQLVKANEFLLRGLHEHKRVCAPDGTLDYPTYGAAMWLVAADRLDLELSVEDRQQLTQWIIDAQLTEAHDISRENIQYGGWDLEATSGAKGEQLKGTNISITSFALEALQDSMHEDAAATIKRAHDWVLRCQNEDGGFVFHVWRPHPGNKAMWTDESQGHAISYATPTCDGVRCLHYCGADADDESLTEGLHWLAEHPDVETVPGFESKAKETGWSDGLRYYYYFTQAKSLPLLPAMEASRRAAALEKLLYKEQARDGSYRNDQPRMFEDDPILATGLALVALSVANEYADKPKE